MKIYIIGDESDKDNINDFCSKLQEEDIESIALYPATDFMAKGSALSTPLAILWISSNSGDEIFNIANERNKKSITSINYFPEDMALSDFQKNTIGRNRSVFASLNPNGSVDDVLSLISTDLATSSSKSLTKAVEASVETNAITNRNNILDNQSILSVREELRSKNIGELSDSIPESNENVSSFEGIQQNGNKTLWMPLIWYVSSILYYECCKYRIIEAWTDQTIWFLVVTLVWFILAYKIIRSTINAIKSNKWCYVYIPFSIWMVYYDLFYGFKLLGAYFD